LKRTNPSPIAFENFPGTKEDTRRRRDLWRDDVAAFTHMKSALFATIFGIIAGVSILLTVPAEGKPPVIVIQPPKSFPDYGEPVVPQIEETPPQEALVPEPMDRYLVTHAKTKKTMPPNRRHVVRPRTNFFQKLVTGFIKLQKPPVAKSVHKRSRITSRAAE
jgi:hypothetical protein